MRRAPLAAALLAAAGCTGDAEVGPPPTLDGYDFLVRWSYDESNDLRAQIGARRPRPALTADTLDPEAGDVPFAELPTAAADGRALFWHRPGDPPTLRVDEAVASDLEGVKLYALDALPDGLHDVGTWRDAAEFAALEPRQVLKALLDLRVLETYAHVGAEVGLVAERLDDERYTARLVGLHEFYTNAKNLERYAVELTIDRASGAMMLRAVGRADDWVDWSSG